MSTRESVAARQAPLVRTPVKFQASKPVASKLLSSPRPLKLAYLVSDLFALTLANVLAVRVVEHFLRVPSSALNPFGYYRFYVPFFAAILYTFGRYKSPELWRPEQELERSCKGVAFSFLGLILFNFVVFRSEGFSRYLLATWFVLALLLLLFMRFMLRVISSALWNAGLCRRRALLLGSTAGLVEYQQLLSIQRHRGYDLVGALLASSESDSLSVKIRDVPILGSLSQWKEVVSATAPDVLIVACGGIPDREEWVPELLQDCKQLRVDVELYSRMFATANSYYEHDEFTGCFRFYGKSGWLIVWQRFVKRSIDIVVGLVGSIVTLLLTPIVWLLVNLEDRGPVFYQREFVGSDGHIHYYLKFRSMLNGADDMLQRDPQLRARFVDRFKLKDDPRLLRVGKFLRRYSLDEFPQFFSVLSGRLAFVGPRVISWDERRRYGSHLTKLLSFKPGLTGFWQVSGRQTTTYEERVQMDMFYIERWSIWLDLVIIVKTFWQVVKAEGAY